MILLEKEREEVQAKEALLAVSMQEEKKKLLDDLQKENAKIEAAVQDLQKLKDQEKAELLSSLHGGKKYFTSFIPLKYSKYLHLTKHITDQNQICNSHC